MLAIIIGLVLLVVGLALEVWFGRSREHLVK
jgi:hypothetical protein